ncbi:MULTISPECIES: DUF1499 domain-containing protein [unclassified Rhizobium]|uniref:DUF1499 domain-containing protein n=1 Tax=unclassified Rhizobium TaxID=2613769 RepID=UPI001A99E51F|nr:MULTISPECIES: DUF1499 domain-containing protein [unclassified Rhizobium]MBX5160375.1 DUF1499 domain-containing protein [Rhizobium sp. NZLR8]MBX5186765.1 DUF1499 domain-containing protein [Rhizobium sp. NZLR5]MBX5191081.1 DUF1499 domain-containing protein [Rhizobium sp. NZLR3b]MBX5204323.1 DUF1499 domain-containing protein [Rhizobium sp. NZLR1]QSZ22038.1 DUF1499 domain-containing protein [Rhizobium sp. NZLR1]
MAIRFDRPVSNAARFSRLLGAFSLVLALAVLVAHRFGGLATPYLVLLLIAAAGGALLAALLAVVGLRSLWMTGAEGGLAALAALIYAAFPLALGAFATEHYLTLPDIYDVSTDPVSVPDWLSPPKADQIWLKRNPVMPEDREKQMTAYPELTGRRYEGALDRVLEAVRKVAKLRGFTIIRTTGDTEPDRDPEDRPAKPEPSDDAAVADAPDIVPVPTPRPYDDDVAKLIRGANGVTLQATNRTLILGLRFDILIRLREEAETTFVDIRVASRYGQHDLGFSADIAGDYLKALDSELLGIAGG